jgi:hypothetical protein
MSTSSPDKNKSSPKSTSSAVTKSMTSKVDCNICASDVYLRHIIACPFCKFDACNKCVTRFLMEIDDSNPRCMNTSCKKIWSFEFLSENFPINFHNKKYRERRASILVGREKSMLPSTQPLAAEELRRRDLNKKISEINKETLELKKKIRENTIKCRELKYSALEKNVEQKKEVFVRACPVEECKGFLSTALKCGMCKVYACKNCYVPKAGKFDEDHKCNPDTVATIKLLSSDTKPCPACSTPIYKIHGCDQMYCTQCHTAFSWNKGTIERGVIHNPHYYEWQRAHNNGVVPRNPRDFVCGGMVDIRQVEGAVGTSLSMSYPWLRHAHRVANHITHVELIRYPNAANEMDNSDLRVCFLLNEITEVQLMSKIKQRMKKQEKDGAINMILTMFTTTMADLFGNIVNDKKNKENILTYIASMLELREYTNNALAKIRTRFEGVVPVITESWEFFSNSKAPEKKKNNNLVELGQPVILPVGGPYYLQLPP